MYHGREERRLNRHDYEVMRICVIAWLRDVRAMEESMRDLEHRIDDMRHRISGVAGVDYSGAGCPGGVAQLDPTGEGVAALHALLDEWDGLAAAYAAEIAGAMALCDARWPNRRALWLHEAGRLTWAQVAGRMGYSVDRAKHMGAEGVAELYTLMPERWRRDVIPNAIPADCMADGRMHP